MPYNPDVYHRRSIRLKGYDYSQAGLYFVTICVQSRKHIEGKHTGSPLHAVVQWFKTMTTNEYIREVKTLNRQPFDKRL